MAPGNADRWACLKTLAHLLRLRYLRLNTYQDLEEGIFAGEEGLSDPLIEKTQVTDVLLNLSSLYKDKFNHLSCISDLQQALEYGQRALGELHETHPARPLFMAVLSVTFGMLDRQDPESNAIDEAIRLSRKALSTKMADNSLHGLTSNNPGVLYIQRYKRLANSPDLDSAIQHMRSAVEITPEAHPDHAGLLTILVACWSRSTLSLEVLMIFTMLSLRSRVSFDISRDHRAFELLRRCLLVYSTQRQATGKVPARH